MKSYQDAGLRKYSEWCHDLRLICEGTGCNTDRPLTYEEFCFLPETKLIKVKDRPLYGFWKQYGDVYGEPRTAREWLEDTNQHIVEPLTEENIRDLALFLGHDEFCTWGNGTVEPIDSNSSENSSYKILTRGFKRL